MLVCLFTLMLDCLDLQWYYIFILEKNRIDTMNKSKCIEIIKLISILIMNALRNLLRYKTITDIFPPRFLTYKTVTY